MEMVNTNMFYLYYNSFMGKDFQNLHITHTCVPSAYFDTTLVYHSFLSFWLCKFQSIKLSCRLNFTTANIFEVGYFYQVAKLYSRM